ncbi:hypothetical protein [Haliangium sp.]|uniref:hypothetical protein n=1 Tax=Haliangium sp. TaxID=2663208 RepID=UPI003D14A38C
MIPKPFVYIPLIAALLALPLLAGATPPELAEASPVPTEAAPTVDVPLVVSAPSPAAPTAPATVTPAPAPAEVAAPAALGEPTNLIHELAKILLSALGAALTLLVTVYVPRLARALERRLKIDIPDPLEMEAERLAFEALSYAEEWARGKAKAAGEKVLSNAKLDQAAAYFRDHASAAVSGWLNERVREYLEAKLGQLRVIRPEPRLALAEFAGPDPAPVGPSTPGAH